MTLNLLVAGVFQACLPLSVKIETVKILGLYIQDCKLSIKTENSKHNTQIEKIETLTPLL